MADGLRGPWPRSSRPGPYSRNSYTPPKKISLGKSGGIRSPPGLNTQHDSTKHNRNALQTGQDSPQEPEALLGWLGGWGFLRAWPGVRGPHRVPQRPPPYLRQGGRRLEWPPWPQQEEPPAPDESPWTRQDRIVLKCSCGHNKTDTRHSWPWHVDYIHAARDSGGQRAWDSANPVGLSQRRYGGHESAAIRRALSQRRAGGHWVRGVPVAWSPANGAPGGAATRELGNEPAGLG